MNSKRRWIKSRLHGLTGWMAVAVLCSGCGSWLGNPSASDDGGQGAGGSGTIPGSSVAWSEGSSQILGPGEVLLQRVTLEEGRSFTSRLDFRGVSLLGDDNGTAIEVSVANGSSLEEAFKRYGSDEIDLEFDPEESGDHLVWVRNNSTEELVIDQLAQDGAASVGDVAIASEREDAPYKNIVVKGVVALARECKDTSEDGNSTVTTEAPEGHVFVQPFVFIGEVQSDGSVVDVTDADVSVTGETEVQSLSRLDDMPFRAYRELSGLSEDQHLKYTKMFYRAYFGGAGELYTVDTFRRYGDCGAMVPLALVDDYGETILDLRVKVARLDIDLREPLRATASTAFSTYFDDERMTDWTQCTYDAVTGEPETYNGDAAACKDLSLKAPPSIRLDYKLPSASGEGAWTEASDPTRGLFYGFGRARRWVEGVLDAAEDLRSDTTSTLALDGCAHIGGLHASPLDPEGTPFALQELRVQEGDIVNLARKTGSYTVLADFYQGDVDADLEFEYPTCIPDGDESCADYKVVKVVPKGCRIKADSGVSVTSVSDSMIYPDYFEISGVVVK